MDDLLRVIPADAPDPYPDAIKANMSEEKKATEEGVELLKGQYRPPKNSLFKKQ